jgi:hypothetical protein
MAEYARKLPSGSKLATPEAVSNGELMRHSFSFPPLMADLVVMASPPHLPQAKLSFLTEL